MNPTRYGRPIFGPFQRRQHTGVPADHFAPYRQVGGVALMSPVGRLVALVAATSGKAGLPLADRDHAWDSGAAEGRIRDWAGGADDIADTDWTKYAQGFFFKDTEGDDGGKRVGDYKLPFADVIDGTLTAVPKGIFAVAGVLQGGRGGVDIPSADKDAIKGKVEAYYSAMAAKFKDDSIEVPWKDDGQAVKPKVLNDMTLEEFADALGIEVPAGPAFHAAFDGTHTHDHSAMGDQGDDDNHSHEHAHDGDASHDHPHGDMAHDHPHAGRTISRLSEAERRRVDGANEIVDPEGLSALVASALARFGDRALTAATTGDGTVVGGKWHAYLCVEGVRTDDGRELMANSCRFPDMPVSLRLLVEDEGGHWGAVTCGRIDMMDRREVEGTQVIYAEGEFGSDPNGQLAELMVGEQTQRFISIDPRDITGQWVEIAVRRTQFGEIIVIDDPDDIDDDVVYDCWWQITDCVIGAATIVAMPALPQAVITPADVALPWSAVAMSTAPVGLVAAGGPLAPPAAWFDDPGFHVGDARLVRQPDGKHACPLTVTDEGRVFGHFCYWGAKHTAVNATPPRSKSGYAHYLTGVVRTDEGVEIPVGQVTMGTGHAPLTKRAGNGRLVPLSPHEVTAHYDGGYGAVQVCDVTVGEDDFGGWFAGALRPGLTDEQIREFKALGLSGDWREMAGSLDLLALLSVPAPGFPIARRALTASGEHVDVRIDSDLHVGVTDERVFALVAAGIVRRPDPARQLAALEVRFDRLEGLVRPLILERAQALVNGG